MQKALSECKELGKHLREKPLFVGNALRNGRTLTARDRGRARQPMASEL